MPTDATCGQHNNAFVIRVVYIAQLDRFHNEKISIISISAPSHSTKHGNLLFTAAETMECVRALDEFLILVYKISRTCTF